MKIKVIFVIQLLILLCCAHLIGDDSRLTGGSATVFQTGRYAFSLPLANLSRENRRRHAVGNSFFNKNWVIAPASPTNRDGLGPLFNANSCSACHPMDGRSAPTTKDKPSPGLVFRFAPGSPMATQWGNQLSGFSVPGMSSEPAVTIRYKAITGEFGDGQKYELRQPVYELDGVVMDQISPRIAPSVFGLGLLEAIPETRLKQLADPNDENDDGISGRLNQINIDGGSAAGRFGWKANQPTLAHQVAAAFVDDIGITTALHPDENLTQTQLSVAKQLTSFKSGGVPELEPDLFEKILTYQRTLAPPAARNLDKMQRGAKLFNQAKCNLCHVASHTTGDSPISELSNQVIFPYTDLLLHNMGEGLADKVTDHQATGAEWRTPPLWGLGLLNEVNGHEFLLHDGRARGFSEAILWHGGEAKQSREIFRLMTKSQRQDLVDFLKSI